jgi:hypothetical protein
MLFWKAACAASLALISACGMSYSPAPDATPSPISTGSPNTPAPTSTALPTPAPLPTGPTAEIEVLVTGGEFDGSYRAVAANACESSPAQNTFTVTYADDSAPDRFVALQLVLRDAAQAQADASSAFSLELSLNGANGGVSYALDPGAGQGEGDAFLDVSLSDATLDLSVVTPDEAIIDLTVLCELASP